MKHNSLLSYKAHTRSLTALGFPIIIGQIGTIVQGLADTIMTGQYNSEALASAGFVNNVMNLILVFALGYSYGLTPVVGSYHARAEHDHIGQSLRSSLQANGMMATIVLLLMGTLYFFLSHLGQPEELLPIIRPYYLVILASLPFQILFNAYKQFFDGISKTQIAMWVMIGANLFNILGNWLLIYGVGPFPELGLLGAGISTLLSRIGMLLFMVGIFHFRDQFALYHKGFHSKENSKALRKQLHQLGMPIGLQMGMECASFSLCAIIQGWIGTSALAAHQVMTNVASVCYMIYYGIGASVAIRISHFNGMKDLANVRRCAFAGYRMTLVCGIFLSAVIVFFRNEISSFFTNDPSVSAIVMSLMVPFVLYQIGDGLQTNFANALRGIADVKPMMRYAFISYIIISLPLSYFLGIKFQWGPVGIWMAFPIALSVAGMLFYWRFNKKVPSQS